MSYAVAFLGKENVRDLEMRMTSEDFAYFSHAIPACLYRLGIRNESKGILSNLHTSTFDVDEKCLETATGLMAWITINELKT
jgi:metal-dependent amidase/aminoacylase/carboxypeptidase family protein